MSLTTTTATMGSRLSDLLKREIDQAWCREQVDLTNAAVDAGQVLCRQSDGKYRAYDPDADDPADPLPSAVALFAGAANGKVIVARRGVILAASALVHKTGATDEQKAASIQALADAGIVALETV